MKIKALRDVSGLVTIKKGEERNVRQKIAEGLIKEGYAEEAKPGASPQRDEPAKKDKQKEPESQ